MTEIKVMRTRKKEIIVTPKISGKKLKQARLKKHLTLQGAAHKMTEAGYPVSFNTVRDHETRNEPKGSTLLGYSAIYKKPAKYFLEDPPKRTKGNSAATRTKRKK